MPAPLSSIFFLSYAQKDTDAYLERFYRDLSQAVLQRMTETVPQPGFQDVHALRSGDAWSKELSKALSTCSALVCLYSPRYVSSEFCGKEWSAFQHRLTTNAQQTGADPHPLIFPVLWIPLGPLYEKLPESVRKIQYHHFKIGEAREGLQSLLSFGDERDYRKFLNDFANTIRDAVERYRLPPLDPPLDIETFPNAFAETPPQKAPPQPRRTTAAPRLRKRPYPEEFVPDEILQGHLELDRLKPKDDFLSLVERVCRKREDTATVERIEGDEAYSDHLLVSAQHGDIIRVFPVGAVEQGISLEGLISFCDHVDSRYRANDSGMISYLVYGGAQQAHEGLLSAGNRRRVRLMSYVEYSGLIDFRNYVLRQTERLERDDIYPPRLYVPQRLKLLADLEFPDALARIDDWLNSSIGRFLLILGDFGTGKTFLLHQLAIRLAESGSGLVPVLLQMRSLEKGRTLDALIAQHFAQEDIPGFTLPKFRYMLEQGRIALLFDGFDELALRVTYERATEHFDTLLEAAQGSAKVIVTSRRQHFLSEQQVLTKLGEQVQLITGNRIGILQPFNRDQIRAFLVQHCGNEEAADSKLKLIDNIKDLLGLSANPRMLGFIADLPEEDLHEAEAGTGSITSATLYRLLLERWLIFEYDRVHPRGAISGLTVEDRWRAVTALSVRLWKTTERSVGLEDLKEDTAKVIRQIDEAFDAAAATFQVGSGTLLVRDDEGNFSFLHQSILEWLVARTAAEEIQASSDSSLLSIRELSPLMIDFLVGLAGREQAVRWAEEALSRSSEETTGKNALLVLTRLGEEIRPKTDLSGQDLSGRDFSGQDFSGAVLDGTNLTAAKLVKTRLTGARLRKADLREADLTLADLRDTDLTEANFSRARLLGTNFSRACLQGARLRYAKLMGASLESGVEVDNLGAAVDPNTLQALLPFAASCQSVAWSADGEWLAIAQDIVIHLFDMHLGREIRALRGHENGVSSVAFSPDGNTLASASHDKSVRLWDTNDGREIRALRGHENGVVSVAFSPDGNTLASASHDNTIHLWDVATGRCIVVLGHLPKAGSPSLRTAATSTADRSRAGSGTRSTCAGSRWGSSMNGCRDYECRTRFRSSIFRSGLPGARGRRLRRARPRRTESRASPSEDSRATLGL